MVTVERLAELFLALDPQKSPARLAFYHFLKNCLPLTNEFRQDMIDTFYDRALSLQYWQTHKKILGETIRADLTAIALRHPFNFDLEQVIHASDLQFVTLENDRDFSSLLAKEIEQLEKLGEKIRVFRLTNAEMPTTQEILVVRLQKSGSVIAQTHTNVAIIDNGKLQLIRPLTQLTYTHELDFAPQVDQILSTSLMRVARFEAVGAKVRGSFIQGASFHRSESFDRPLADVPELLLAVKKLERFYVNPVSDPYYHQLVEQSRYEKNF